MFNLRDIPPVTKIIILLNVAVFVIGKYLMPDELSYYLPLWYFKLPWFRPYQILSSMFMHGGWLHLIVNMVAFYSFGTWLERFWGSKKFFSFYMISGIGSAIMVLAIGYLQVTFFNYDIDCMNVLDGGNCIHPVVGASGAITGIFAGFALMMPDAPLQIILIPINIKAIHVLYGFLTISVVGLFGILPIGLSHEGHLGGLLTGMLLFKTSWLDRMT